MELAAARLDSMNGIRLIGVRTTGSRRVLRKAVALPRPHSNLDRNAAQENLVQPLGAFAS
jgi:hypothetical protein